MDFMLIFKAILSLAFVLGAVFVVFGLMKFCEVKGAKSPFFKKLAGESRLTIVETKRVGAKNQLVLARLDDEEYFLLLSNNQSLLLKAKKVDKNG